ncbi:hypothetical protein TruAng_006594 [Truncatella angustata]|nr:hypothetical protein TruAng_006594 [Truncatella angustata]
MSATSGYDENELLWDILGPPDYDNLDEPVPWSNKKSTIMGLTITFMLTAGVVSVWGLVFTILAFFPCWPVSDFWYSPADAKCWGYGAWSTADLVATFYSHTAMNMLLDIVILAIPFHLYFKSDMTFKMRMGLLALLLMGAIVSFLSIWRLQTLVEHQAGRYPTHDPTWYGPISLLLATLECDCASICASVPIFWPVLSPYLGAIFVTQEVSVEHEYRDMDEESKVQHSSKSLPRPGSSTELKDLKKQEVTTTTTTNMHYFYDDEGSAPLQPQSSQSKRPGTHTRVRSDSTTKDKKRGWVQL